MLAMPSFNLLLLNKGKKNIKGKLRKRWNRRKGSNKRYTPLLLPLSFHLSASHSKEKISSSCCLWCRYHLVLPLKRKHREDVHSERNCNPDHRSISCAYDSSVRRLQPLEQKFPHHCSVISTTSFSRADFCQTDWDWTWEELHTWLSQ